MDGAAKIPEAPNLAGQSEIYLAKSHGARRLAGKHQNVVTTGNSVDNESCSHQCLDDTAAINGWQPYAGHT
jgi:cytochrome c553